MSNISDIIDAYKTEIENDPEIGLNLDNINAVLAACIGPAERITAMKRLRHEVIKALESAALAQWLIDHDVLEANWPYYQWNNGDPIYVNPEPEAEE